MTLSGQPCCPCCGSTTPSPYVCCDDHLGQADECGCTPCSDCEGHASRVCLVCTPTELCRPCGDALPF